MSMLHLFTDYSDKRICLIKETGCITITSTLKPNQHQYIYTNIISLSSLDVKNNTISIAAISNRMNDISLVIRLLTDKKKQIAAKIFSVNKVNNVEIKDSIKFVQLGFRIQGTLSCKISQLLCDEEAIKHILYKRFCFPSINTICGTNFFSYSEKYRPLILLETVFCDIENNSYILEMYFSYLNILFSLVELQIYCNFYWSISISSDKQSYITRLKKIIKKSSIKNKVFLNVYDHPKTGYFNQQETNIDRVLKPNVTIPIYREALYNKFIEWLEKQENNLHERMIVRTAVDDDDFISPWHFLEIAKAGKLLFKEANQELLYVGFPNIGIIYSGIEKFDLDIVIFSKMMTGAKFNVSIGLNSISPFSIPENFPQSTQYIKYTTEEPTFYYHRHGVNLSSSSKRAFYDKKIKSVILSSHRELLHYVIGKK